MVAGGACTAFTVRPRELALAAGGTADVEIEWRPSREAMLCALAEAPLSVMKQTRSAGRVDLDDFAQQLKAKAFPVFSQDEHNMQVELAACAGQ